MTTRRTFLSSAVAASFIGGCRSGSDTAIAATGEMHPALRGLDDAMTTYMRKHDVPGGALAFAKDGRLVHARGYGVADDSRPDLVQPTSLFRIASVSKPVTAVAVLALLEDHPAISLETPAVALLDVTPWLAAGTTVDPRMARITIRQLLQHTAGFDRDVDGDALFQTRDIAEALDVAVPADAMRVARFVLGRRLVHDPGTHHVYSNVGYCLLGLLIEKVSGERYESFVLRRVLRPLGIVDMRLGATRERAYGEVAYHARGGWFSVFPPHDFVPFCYGGSFQLEAMAANGGWLASAVDLVRFTRVLDDDAPVLSARSREQLFARPPAPLGVEADGTPSPVWYGAGWTVRTLGADGGDRRRNVWHHGAFAGTSSALFRLDNGWTVAALINRRVDGDAIEEPIFAAAGNISVWPQHDLFGAG